MTYLGRNVNLALLVIIIGVVVALVGTTVFFQRGLQNRTQEYQSTADTLGECEVAKANYESKLSQAQAEVNQTTQDIRKYDTLYEQKTGELKDTQQQLLDTRKDYELAKHQAVQFQQMYESQLQTDYELNQSVTSLSTQLTNAKADLRSCQRDLDSCEGP